MTDAPTILSCLRETVRQYPDRPAVSDCGRTVTYCELWSEAERYASELDVRGVVRGRANLVEARPMVSFAIAAVGTYLAGRVFVPYAKDVPVGVVQRIRKDTDAPWGLDVADVLHTTGTTGVSKGVVVSHHAAWAAADNNRHFDRMTEDAVCLIASPLNHVSALRKLEACFLVGAHAVLQDGFLDVKRYYETIVRHRVNMLLLPPAAVLLLLSVSRGRLQSLADQVKVVHSNGAPMPEALKDSLRRCLPHARLVFAYGATEAGSSCCAYDYAEFPGKANCVGKASPHVKMTVEDGCLVVAGDTVMEGYLNDPVRSADVLRDGKVYTNDLARIDDEGFVYVLGRKDDVINCGGMKVAPVEVEEAAMRYPGIADCACFGVEDRFTGHAVRFLVVPRDAQDFDLAALRAFLRCRLERHQLPSRITCVAAIPKKNGKTDRVRLRSLA